MEPMRDVCVLGLGLIGGSLLRAASKAGRQAWGAADSAADVEAARVEGFDVCGSVPEALRRAWAADALVVLAVPLTAVERLCAQLAHYAPEVPLTDVVSVKQPVAETVARLAPRARYVGGHPMAGTASSGWSAGSAGLFERARWVVCTAEDGSLDREVWLDVLDLALSCGAGVVPATSSAHDAAVARISHLPHVLAAVLAAAGAGGGPLALSLAAGSFADGTRVAATHAELTLAMCEGNTAALLPALDEALGRLGAARAALASTGSLRATVCAGAEARSALDARGSARRAEVWVDLDSPEAVAALLGVGGRGGEVLAREEGRLLVRVPAEDPKSLGRDAP
jgi:prephenate dehydrogenase